MNHIMQIDFLGNRVRAETEGLMVSLNDIVKAGNSWRQKNGYPLKLLSDLVKTQQYKEIVKYTAKRNRRSEAEVVKTYKGRLGRTMAHVYIAIYIAEQMSPEFHVEVLATFVEGKLLEFRQHGATEFRVLNAAIDAHLPGREHKESNKGVFIQVAKRLRASILGEGSKAGDWACATVDQTHLRFEHEKTLSTSLSLGLIQDYNHLKEVIDKL